MTFEMSTMDAEMSEKMAQICKESADFIIDRLPKDSGLSEENFLMNVLTTHLVLFMYTCVPKEHYEKFIETVNFYLKMNAEICTNKITREDVSQSTDHNSK
jgi:hypothetical protein